MSYNKICNTGIVSFGYIMYVITLYKLVNQLWK